MRDFWWRPMLIGIGLAFAFYVFWQSESPAWAWGAVAVTLLVFFLHHLWHLYKLTEWLRRPELAPPRGDGVWGDASYLLNKLLVQGQTRQDKAVADLEQMLAATRSLPDGVVILEEQGRIRWLNEAAERQLGLSRTRDAGQFIHYLLRNASFVEWLALEDFSQPLAIKSPANRETTLSLQIVPMLRGQRMLLSRDITELERVDATRRDFVANVSHELRTPITVIAGFLEAFEDMGAPEPEAFGKHVRLMLDESNRIRHLLDDLLLLARLEGEQDMKNETVDVPRLAEQLLVEARALSQGQHQIELMLRSQARLIGREQELHSALGNLVSNAVRYTPPGGAITLCWNVPASGAAEFSVRDTGEGIAPQHIPRLTERFYRVDRGRSRATGGTGLGLAIVKHILQRHQGRLRIESTVGKGSTFTAVLPPERVIPGEAAPTAPSADAP